MAGPDVFTFKDYRKFLNAAIAANRLIRGYHRQLAEAAGCQPSYLSKVLAEKCELTPDQAAGMALFFQFTDLEAEYFLNIVLLARAAARPLKQMINKKLKLLRADYENLQKRFQLPAVGTNESYYYSAWFVSALHILSAIPAYQTARAMAHRLGLGEEQVRDSLQRLQGMGVVEQRGDKWHSGRGSIHAARGTPFAWSHHASWRQRALFHSQVATSDGIHYTSLHSLSTDDMEKLKQELLRYLSYTRDVVPESKEETAICINIDFFEI